MFSTLDYDHCTAFFFFFDKGNKTIVQPIFNPRNLRARVNDQSFINLDHLTQPNLAQLTHLTPLMR